MKIIAVIGSDLHLSHRTPAARDAEPDWYEAQMRVLDQVYDVCENFGAPFILAGDMFHKWNSPVGLVNAALRFTPRDFYAVPGQHDLPCHEYAQAATTAYGTFLAAGRVTDLSPWNPCRLLSADVDVVGVPWGFLDKRPKEFTPSHLNGFPKVLIGHAYIWAGKDTAHVAARPEQQVETLATVLDGFTHAFFGDNHIPFSTKVETPSGTCRVINCGAMQRTASDQENHRPRVWLLREDGAVKPHYLDISKDRFSRVENTTPRTVAADIDSMIEALGAAGTVSDFMTMLVAEAEKQLPKIRQHILKVIDNATE